MKLSEIYTVMFKFSLFSDQHCARMPRSNKKKAFVRPPTKHPTGQSTSKSTDEISSLLSEERNKMISRATASARKHGIQLEHGSMNPGTGDCAFQVVVQNNNDRV